MRKLILLSCVIIPLLSGFTGHLIKVKIFGAEFQVPPRWKFASTPVYKLLIRDNDTLFFSESDTGHFVIPFLMKFENCPDWNDSVCLNRNRFADHYNDSLQLVHPALKNLDEVHFYQYRHYSCSGYIPHGTTRVNARLIFTNNNTFYMHTSPMNSGEFLSLQSVIQGVH